MKEKGIEGYPQGKLREDTILEEIILDEYLQKQIRSELKEMAMECKLKTSGSKFELIILIMEKVKEGSGEMLNKGELEEPLMKWKQSVKKDF